MEQHYTEFTGKTVEEAVEAGLEALGLAREEADVRVLEEGKKKLFGFVKARVEIAPKIDLNAFKETLDEDNESPLSPCPENDENASEKEWEGENQTADASAEIHVDNAGRTDGERAVEFLEGLFDILRITACTELTREAEKIEINVTAANTNAVIGKRGAMLDAIQTIAGAVANKGRSQYKRVVVDCENYRENREATLRSLASKLAEKAVRYEKKLKLEPMNPYERRIIHAALSENPAVTTESEGKEPYRYIVIIPGNVRYPDRPASPARPERPQRGGYNDRGGYRKPYNKNYGRSRDGNYNREGGYNRDGEGRRPYNKDAGRDGYKKPYNKDYNRENRDNRSGYNGYNRGERRPDSGEGGTNIGGERDYNKTRAYKKPSSDFFGTFLGNSKDNDGDQE